MSLGEADYLTISGVQHFYFCKRQWALIHLERQWAENARTFGGSLMHRNADNPYFTECRGNTLISRGMPLVSHALKLQGVADAVEFCRAETGVKLSGRDGHWLPAPVEYKYGRAKDDDTDIVQLTAQAICLEEMLRTQIARGYIYYGKTRRREAVTFTPERRGLVGEMSRAMYALLAEGRTPAPEYKKNCKNCSLHQLCVPELAKRKKKLVGYIERAISDMDMDVTT